MSNAHRKKIRIGDLLVQHHKISESQLKQALSEQKKSGRKLGQVLVGLGYIDDSELLQFLAEQLQIPFVDLKHYQVDPDTVRLLPETYARRFRAIVLKAAPIGFLVGMADPTDIFAYDELSRVLQVAIRPAVVRETDLMRTVDMVYRHTEEITSLAEELG